MDIDSSWRWLGGLSCGVAVLTAVKMSFFGDSRPAEYAEKKKKENDVAKVNGGVRLEKLHKEFLFLHFFIKLADWLQGTNMYTLYSSYGVNIGLLFMTGFVSSAISSTVLGHWVDKHGRKMGCLVYCALEIIIQVLEHSHDIKVLLFGRMLGGISTALLFSAFESWVVSEHRALKLPSGDAALESMFSTASTLNGIAAVLAGFIARAAFQYGGEIAPFQVSLVITILCMIWIAVKWTENTGATTNNTAGMGGLLTDVGKILGNSNIVRVAAMQALFEGAMYTFVFMWVSVFLSLNAGTDTRPPIELLFSALMLALSIGGLVFDLLCSNGTFERHRTGIGAAMFIAASLAMAFVATLIKDGSTANEVVLGVPVTRATLVMIAFCVFETCVGMFDPWSASMRSMYVPQNMSATVMTLARVPLNLFVGLGVHLTENFSLFAVFSVCSVMHALCAIICLSVGTLSNKIEASKKAN